MFSRPPQRRVIEALRSERDAVHAGGDPVSDGHVVHIVRIRLNRYLRCVRDSRTVPDGRQNVANANSSEPRGSPAAQVHRVEGRAFQILSQAVHLGSQGRDVLIDGGRGSYRNREITVRATPGAEWDVDVKVTRGHK